jgi:serine/arginine repetitive matrix protein 2
MVNAATTELSDLINRLDLTATPEASPARRWLQATPEQSPDAMPEFAIATVERAIRQRYPDVPSSVRSEGNTTFNADSSFGADSTPHPPKLYNMGNLPLSGSVADLRRGGSIGPGPFLSNALREEPSITSLRPYRMAKNLPAIHLSPSSEPSSGSPSSTDVDSPVNHRTARRSRRSVRPRAQSSEESLHDKLRQLSPRAHCSVGMRGTLPNYSHDVEESSLSSGRDDPTSESADDMTDSDIPDELRMVIAHKEDDTGSSLRSLDDSISTFSRPLSEASNRSAEPTTRSHPHPFSITVTAPSVSSHDSDVESPIEDERDREDDTGKKSFDFTGEINRLNQGGARISFVEKLEEAFRDSDDLKSPTLHDYSSQDGSPTALQWDLTGSGSNANDSLIMLRRENADILFVADFTKAFPWTSES